MKPVVLLNGTYRCVMKVSLNFTEVRPEWNEKEGPDKDNSQIIQDGSCHGRQLLRHGHTYNMTKKGGLDVYLTRGQWEGPRGGRAIFSWEPAQ